jgi:hypothetical protein
LSNGTGGAYQIVNNNSATIISATVDGNSTTINVTNYNLSTDSNNCGAVGYTCVNGRTCDNGKCSPAWQTISTDNAPTPRWAGIYGSLEGKYVVSGGCLDDFSGISPEQSTYVYDPNNDSWSLLSTNLNIPRFGGAGITTPSGIFAFGGLTECMNGGSSTNTLEVLFSLDGNWTTINSPNAPNPKYATFPIWTGSEIFLYAGANWSSTSSDGAILIPGGSWKNISCPLSGCDRSGAFTYFYSKGMIHGWGGGNDPTRGILYDLDQDEWYDWLVPSNTPNFNNLQTSGNVRYADDGRRLFYLGSDLVWYIYDRVTEVWSTNNLTTPSGLCSDGQPVWTGSEIIVWSGNCNGTLSSVGARYQPPAPQNQ